MDITGNLNVKMDDNTVNCQGDWLVGQSRAILVGDEGTSTGSGATKIFFEFPTVKFTGHNVNLGATDGVFIDLPFTATATDSGKLMYLKLT